MKEANAKPFGAPFYIVTTRRNCGFATPVYTPFACSADQYRTGAGKHPFRSFRRETGTDPQGTAMREGASHTPHPSARKAACPAP